MCIKESCCCHSTNHHSLIRWAVLSTAEGTAGIYYSFNLAYWLSNNIIYVMIDDIVGNQCAVNPGLLMGIRALS